MSWHITPILTIDSEQIDCDPAVLPFRPIAVGGIKIQWGRESLDDETTPASMTLQLLDTSDTWAKRIRGNTAIGSVVELGYRGEAQGMHTQNIVGRLFLGRIKEAHARLGPTLEDGTRTWRITLTCADATADLGHASSLIDGWEGRNFQAVLDQLDGAVTQKGLVDSLDTSWALDPLLVQVRMTGIKDESILTIMADIIRGAVNRAWVFNPENATISTLPRPHFQGRVGFVAADTTPRGKVAIAPLTRDMRNVAHISGCEAKAEPEIISDMRQRVYDIRVTTFDGPLSDERSARRSSKVIDNAADGQVIEWESIEVKNLSRMGDKAFNDMVRDVKARRTLPGHVEFDTSPTFHFTSIGEVNTILATWEDDTRFIVITGDIAHRWVFGTGARPPVMTITGGTLRYDPLAGWSQTFRPAYTDITIPTPQPLTWRQLMQQAHKGTSTRPYWKPYSAPAKEYDRVKERDIYWGAPDGEKYRFDPSITWGDLAYIDKHDGKDIIDLKGETR